MHATFTPVAVTSGEVLQYAAAFFFVLVAIAMAYALIKAAKTLERVDKVLADVDHEAVPLMQKAGVSLDGVNANLTMSTTSRRTWPTSRTRSTPWPTSSKGPSVGPARKAAAFSAGVQTAVSSFMRRDRGEASPEGDPFPEADWGSSPEQSAPAASASTAEAASAVADVKPATTSATNISDLPRTPAPEDQPWVSPQG